MPVQVRATCAYVTVSAMTSVAIAICTRDRPDELAATLASLARSSSPVDRVVVSDDGTDERTHAVCRACPIAVDYTTGPRRGLAPNRNHALRLITEDVVLFLDDDCLLGVEFLDIALASMAEHEATHGSGRVIVTGVETKHDAVVHASAQTFLGFQARPYRRNEPLTSVVINATLFPRTLFDTHLFDERIRYGYEEVDLATRAVSDHYAITSCPQAINEHRPSPRSRDDYADVVVAARLFVTFKRYAHTEHRYGRAAAFAIVAPLHAIGAAVKARGLTGAREAFGAIMLACCYLRAYRAGESMLVESSR